jgi:hypothetical protein
MVAYMDSYVNDFFQDWAGLIDTFFAHSGKLITPAQR